MAAADVLAVLHRLADAGLRVWVGGGWGVDALLGQQSREHADLDLSLDARSLDSAVAVLERMGYQVVDEQLPVRLVMGDHRGRRVDLHPVTFDASGAGVQVGFDGPLCYPSDGFSHGVIGGESVGCFSAALQLRFHSGYPPQAKDRQDMQRLAQRTGLPLPPALREDPGSAASVTRE